jgi:hypothetical protein
MYWVGTYCGRKCWPGRTAGRLPSTFPGGEGVYVLSVYEAGRKAVKRITVRKYQE